MPFHFRPLLRKKYICQKKKKKVWKESLRNPPYTFFFLLHFLLAFLSNTTFVRRGSNRWLCKEGVIYRVTAISRHEWPTVTIHVFRCLSNMPKRTSLASRDFKTTFNMTATTGHNMHTVYFRAQSINFGLLTFFSFGKGRLHLSRLISSSSFKFLQRGSRRPIHISVLARDTLLHHSTTQDNVKSTDIPSPFYVIKFRMLFT